MHVCATYVPNVSLHAKSRCYSLELAPLQELQVLRAKNLSSIQPSARVFVLWDFCSCFLKIYSFVCMSVLIACIRMYHICD